MKQPDRFERIANKFFAHEGPFYAVEVAHLLRKEHAWVRRMVRKVDAWACQELVDNDDVIAEILKQLDQRRL